MTDVRQQKIHEAEIAFSAKWARIGDREAEIRRPVRKVDVISACDEERGRMRRAKELYNVYLRGFIKAYRFRDIRFGKEFFEFGIKYFDTSEYSDKGVSDATMRLANTLSLYCQSFHDPNIIVALWKDENIEDGRTYFPGLEAHVNYEFPSITLTEVAEYIKRFGDHSLIPEYLSSKPYESILKGRKNRTPPPEFLIDEIEKAIEKNDLRPNTIKFLQKVMDSSKLKNALRALVTQACLDTMTVVEESGLAVTQLGLLRPEGAGDIPETYVHEKSLKLEDLFEELKSTRTQVGRSIWLTYDQESMVIEKVYTGDI